MNSVPSGRVTAVDGAAVSCVTEASAAGVTMNWIIEIMSVSTNAVPGAPFLANGVRISNMNFSLVVSCEFQIVYRNAESERESSDRCRH